LEKELSSQLLINHNLIANFEREQVIEIKGLTTDIRVEKSKLLKTQEDIRGLKYKSHKLPKWEHKLTKLVARKDKHDNLSNQVFKLEMLVQSIQGKILDEKATQKTLIEVSSKVITNCPRCEQKLSRAYIKKERSKVQLEINLSRDKVEILKESLLKPESEFNKLNEVLELNKHLYDKINKASNKVTLEVEKKAKLVQLNAWVELINDRVLNLGKNLIRVKSRSMPLKIESTQLKVDKLKIIIHKLQEEVTKYNKELELSNWLIKDPLSNSGIKAYIFNQMMGLVNGKLSTYCKELGFEINFNINLESAHKDFYITISQGDNLRFYEDLSGGEQQLVNVCIAFAIHDVICMEKDINILVMDECFESLDPANVGVISNLISIKTQGNRSIHIISHLDVALTNANNMSLRKHKTKGTILV